METVSTTERILNRVIRILLNSICKLDIADLRKVAHSGPGIVMTNHTSNIEGPAVYVYLRPRRTIGLAKIELWDNPITRLLMNVWESIPVHRGRVDSVALRACIKALENESFLGVAPEGTRSRDGILKQAQPGVAMLAARTGAPVYPTAQWGFIDIGRNLKRLRRTPATIRMGPPFTVKLPEGVKPSMPVLRQVADEMMYQLAALLPERYRGVYGDLSKATTEYLQFALQEADVTGENG